MSITIIKDFTDGRFYPSANPINCTVNSNNNGKCNMRYICDVYVNNVKVYTNKLFPDPTTGYAFFQVSRILQDYIESVMPVATTTDVISLASSNTAPTANLTVKCKFGEEYDSSTDCDNVINQFTNLKTSNTFYVFEGAQDYEDFLTFDWQDYYMGDNGVTYTDNVKFLTNSPRIMDVTYNDQYFLDFFTLDQIETNYRMNLFIQYKNGSTLNSNVLQAPVLSTNDRYRMNCGPLDINTLFDDALINQSVLYYTVTLTYAFTEVSETFRFNVKKPQPFQTRFAFVGLMGGIEHYTFYHRNKKTFNVDRKNFTKTLQSNHSSNWTYEVGDRGDTTYKTSAKETHAVATYCSRDVSEWLYEMWMSPNVWTYKRPELQEFKIFREDSSPTSRMLFWIKDTSLLSATDEIFCFPDTSYTDYQDKFTITSVSGHIVDCGLTFDVYNTSNTACGWFHKDEAWKTLPIVISDSAIEVKQKTRKPVEYSLNYSMAYQKTTLRG